MKSTFIQTFSILILSLCLCVKAAAQGEVIITYPEDKLGPYSATHRFKELSLKDYGYKLNHHFKPKKGKTKAYRSNGKVFFLNENETIELAQLYEGEYDGKKGLWIHPFVYHFAYIYIEDVIDIEKDVLAEREVSAKARQVLREEETAENIRLFFKLLPYILGFTGLVILLYGLSSICPKCSAWWKREWEKTESLGYSTYSGTRSVRKDVYDSLGSTIGHTFVDEPYTKTTHHYRIHYRCKKCGHKWTKDKHN